MWIGVAIHALAKRNASVARLRVRPRSVAFLAGDRSVQSGQGIASFRVIQLADLDRLPIVEIVTLQTVGTKPSFVLVLVATGAVL